MCRGRRAHCDGLRGDSGCAAASNWRRRYGAFRCAALVIATGGLSIPKMGATPFGYEVARQFGLGVVECRPALVPLTFAAADREQFDGLAGVSTEVIAAVPAEGTAFPGEDAVHASRAEWTGNPAGVVILARREDGGDRPGAGGGFRGVAGCVPGGWRWESKCARCWRGTCRNALPTAGARCKGPEESVAALSDREVAAIAADLHAWHVRPAGTEGFEKAEVTAGGVDTAGLSSKTMECRDVPGLYFIGEVVDVTGQLGGFNFQWAWASGAAAGRAV